MEDLVGFARHDAAAEAEAKRESEDVLDALTGAVPHNPQLELLDGVLVGTGDAFKVEDLLRALRALSAKPELDIYEERAVRTLSGEAAHRLPDTKVAKGLAEVLINSTDRLPSLSWEVFGQIRGDREKRRALTAALVQTSEESSSSAKEADASDQVEQPSRAKQLDKLLLHLALVNYSEDVSWPLSRLEVETDADRRASWLKLVEVATGYSDRGVWEPVLQACLSSSWSWELFGLYLKHFAPREVTGPQADERREWEKKRNEQFAAREAMRVPHAKPLPEELDFLLLNDELDTALRWWQALNVLSLERVMDSRL